jgi:dTDP-glucose 4,6-dehydratase
VNLFVTGGAGFIGTNFVRIALERGHRILNYDSLTYAGRRENLIEFEGAPGYHFVHADICDSAYLNKELSHGFDGKPFDAIINIAAESHVDRSLNFATSFSRTNCVGVTTLLEAALQNKVNIFIQVSTDEVYGSLGESGSFTLDSPLHPSSPYSASKAAGDLVALSFSHSFGLDVRITRCTNNYGPYQYPEKFIPTIITHALGGRPIPVFARGLNVRDWIFVDDHCDAIFTVLEKGTNGNIYHFGGSTELTNIDLLHTILQILAAKTQRPLEEFTKLITFVADRPGHDLRYSLDWSESEKELGWKPKTPFTEGIQRTVEWYLNNQDWWQHLQIAR